MKTILVASRDWTGDPDEMYVQIVEFPMVVAEYDEENERTKPLLIEDQAQLDEWCGRTFARYDYHYDDGDMRLDPETDYE